jgi:hypothetical protein
MGGQSVVVSGFVAHNWMKHLRMPRMAWRLALFCPDRFDRFSGCGGEHEIREDSTQA